MAPEITTGAGSRQIHMCCKNCTWLWLCLCHDASINITLICFCCLFCVMSDFVLSLMDMGLQVFVHAGLLCNKRHFLKSCVFFCFFVNTLTVAVIGDYGRDSVHLPYAPLNSENISVLPQWKPPRNIVLYQSTGCVPPFKLVYQLDELNFNAG